MYVKHAAFHPYWNKKWCTLEDVAEEIKTFRPNLADKVNAEVLSSVRRRGRGARDADNACEPFQL